MAAFVHRGKAILKSTICYCNLKMKVKKRTALKFTVLITLLNSPILILIIPGGIQALQSLKKRLQPPTIRLCFDPNFKPSDFQIH